MFNVAFAAGSPAEAKAELNSRNAEQETPMSDDLVSAVETVLDQVGGSGGFDVGLFGDNDGALQLTVRRS